jgi:DNA polymerase III epsilon subunit family exonuclease
MTGQLGYSMFQDVLFPALDQSQVAQADAVLKLRRVKRFLPDPSFAMPDASLVVFDLETTGLDADVDRNIEIGAIKLRCMEPVEQFSTLVKADLEVTEDITKITGITQDMLEGQPPIDDVLPKFLEFIEGSILVAHNAEFDLSMVRAACSRAGVDLEWPTFCTLKMARELLPDLENKKLDTIAKHYGLTFEARHRSVGDVKVTVGVLKNLLAQDPERFKLWSGMQPFTVES